MARTDGMRMTPLVDERGKHIGWGHPSGYITTPSGQESQRLIQNEQGGLKINSLHIKRKELWGELFEVG